jgi:hypothetical protein
MPTFIPEECQTNWAGLASCLDDGRARLGAYWHWDKSASILLEMTRVESSVGLRISYLGAEAVKDSGVRGL